MASFCFFRIVQGKRNSLQETSLEDLVFYKILSVAGMALEGKQKYSEAEKGTEDPTWMPTMEYTAQSYSHNNKGKSSCHLLYRIVITIAIITIPGEQQK